MSVQKIALIIASAALLATIYSAAKFFQFPVWVHVLSIVLWVVPVLLFLRLRALKSDIKEVEASTPPF